MVRARSASYAIRRPRRFAWRGAELIGAPRFGGAACAALGVMWLAQVSIPLTPIGRRQAGTTIVVVALVVAVGLLATAELGGRRAVAAAAGCCGLGLGAEVVGTRTGWPFGAYTYTAELAPRVFGVPAIVVVAWFGMGLPAWAVASRLVAGGGTRRVASRIGIGAVALTGWDLFLDPQMVRERYWIWPNGGAYRGIPLSNFAGWFLVSGLLMAVLASVAPLASPRRSLPGVYALMAAMETLGFAVFFGAPLVALCGGVVCLPLAFASLRRPRVRAT